MTRSRKSTPKMMPQLLAEQLRKAIISGTFRPGQQLVEDRLAEQYGTSRVPVREALRILEGEGYVLIRPYSGTFVDQLTEKDAEDLLEVRGALEPLAASRAATRRTPEQLVELREIMGLGTAAIEAGRLDLLPDLNARFHGVLIDASGNRSLKLVITQLQSKIDWVYSIGLPRRAADSWAEHRLILNAVEQSAVDSARALMAAHIHSAEEAYRLREAAARED
jgi:DNA-binding GntR family transcriptional regulator